MKEHGNEYVETDKKYGSPSIGGNRISGMRVQPFKRETNYL
jgi:hypothetical protein